MPKNTTDKYHFNFSDDELKPDTPEEHECSICGELLKETLMTKCPVNNTFVCDEHCFKCTHNYEKEHYYIDCHYGE